MYKQRSLVHGSMTARTASIPLAVFLVVGLVAMVPLGVAAVQDHDSDQAEGPDETRPGERLAGVVGVHGTELDGEMESRAFGVAVAEAESDEARADVIAAQFDRNERRLADVETRRAELREQRDAGEISEGTYRARIAVTVAQTEATRHTTGQGASAAEDLPEDLREERGIDAAAVTTLQERADELTGPEVAEIARGIAGDSVGRPIAVTDERPDRGRPAGGQSDDSPSDRSQSSGGQSTTEGAGDGRPAGTPTPTPTA